MEPVFYTIENHVRELQWFLDGFRPIPSSFLYDFIQ